MVNILFVHSSADLYGSDRSLLRTLKYLDRDKYAPIVVLPYKGMLNEELERLNIPVYVINMGVVRRRHWNPLGFIRMGLYGSIGIIKMLRIIKREDIRIIHSNTSAVIAGAVAAKLAKIPHIWHVRELYDLRKISGKMYIEILDRFSNKIICVSKAVKDNLVEARSHVGGKISVVNNCINVEDYETKCLRGKLAEKYGCPSEMFIFGSVGRINRVKGHDLMLRAASKIKEKHPEALFLIAGDVFSIEGDDKEKWRKDVLTLESKRRGIEDDFRFIGFVKQIEEIFSLMDVYMFTSTEPDSFPTTLLEAMASGKPVIAADIGGVKEIVEDGSTGILVDPGDEAGFIKAAERLINDAEFRREAGRRGKERCVEKFSIDRYISEIENVYDEIVVNGPAGSA